MGSNSRYESYIVDITLPPAIILPAGILALVYAVLLILDYILVKNDTKLARIISPKLLRLIIATYHFLAPIFFASKYDFGNISFMLHPWVTAAQIVYLAKSNLNLRDWMPMMVKIGTFQDMNPTTDSPREIRIKGLQKVARGIAKFLFMKIALDGILPADLSELLALPFYSPRAMFITYVLAVRIYCMVSIVDVVMGSVQAAFLIRFNDVFDNPFVSTSPKDFWSRRWNRLVSRMFHQFIFVKVIANKNAKKSDDQVKPASRKCRFFTPQTAYGLLIFFLSGLFHDLMIAAAARNISFELTAFFLIHGVAVALEANCRTGKYKQDPNGVRRVLCNLLTVLFFVTTGRLFLSPVLRNEVFLRVAQEF